MYFQCTNEYISYKPPYIIFFYRDFIVNVCSILHFSYIKNKKYIIIIDII